MAGGGATSESESTGYGYLPYISPQVATAIGQTQANAANQAAQYARQTAGDALANITKNYTSAVSGLAPTTAAGYQAQLELGKYMGLDAVSPGAKPVAPTAYTPTNTDIQNYLKSNMQFGELGNDQNAYITYGGVGSQYDGWSMTGGANSRPSGQQIVGQIYGPRGTGQNAINPGVDAAAQSLMQQTGLIDQVKNYLTTQYQDTNKELIAANQAKYDQDLQLYNQNKEWYDKYAAEGPYSAQQITENISNQPGYQAQQTAGTDAIQKAASAKGLLSSGNMLKDLATFGSQLQGEYYNNTLNRLAQQAAAGTSAATTLAGAAQQAGATNAQLYSNLGENLANSSLAGGQAMANALQLGNQQYRQVITGQSRSSQSSGGGGLSGIGSVLGGLASMKGAGMFGGAAMASSKTYKTKGKKVNLDLDALDELPVEKWKYTKESEKGDPTEEHIGPYAEDFQKVFGVGDGKSIPIVSSLGILYGLVKKLNDKVDKTGKKRK